MTRARLLEESVRPSLAAALPELADGGIRLANEDNTGKPLPLPSVVIQAIDQEINYTIKSGDNYGRNAELRVACRVDGTPPDSAAAAEALAARVEAAIEPVTADWIFFQPFRLTDERTFDDRTRVITLLWRLIVLPAV